MNKLPSAKKMTRFVLLTTPAIALVLFGIHQMLEPVTQRVPVDCYRGSMAQAQSQIPMIDQLLPVPKGFKPVAEVWSRQISCTSPDIYGIPSYSRIDLCVELPKGLTRKDVNDNLRFLARKEFESGTMSVDVLASTRFADGLQSELIFAPHGDWDRTDRVYNLDEYKTMIKHASDLTVSSIQIANAKRQIPMIDQLLPVPYRFKHVGKIVWKHTRSAGYDDPDNIDTSVKDIGVAFPQNMPIQEIDANLRAIAREFFEDGASYITVSAYSADPTGNGLYLEQVARLTFAPYGDLSKTDRIYNINEYKAVIQHDSSFPQWKQKIPVRITIVDDEPVQQGAEEQK